jgi:putative hydrolase of HD superfamily
MGTINVQHCAEASMPILREYDTFTQKANMRQIIAFILELDKLKSVERRTRPLGLNRQENSAEHSWQIALSAITLSRYATAPVDVDRVIKMLLVHDVGEIDTGDTIVYAEEGLAERKAAERAAVERIFGMLPDGGGECLTLWQEFEDAETHEARFAHAIDRAMPALLNIANNGQSWVENSIRYEQVLAKIGPPIEAGCPLLWAHMKAELDVAYAAGWYGTRRN